MRHFDNRFFADFAVIEGNSTLERRCARGISYTVSRAANWLSNFKELIEEEKKEITTKYCIYGSGGINRWYVAANGEVMFSDSHCYKQGVVEWVRDKGFEII